MYQNLNFKNLFHSGMPLIYFENPRLSSVSGTWCKTKHFRMIGKFGKFAKFISENPKCFP